MNVADDIHNAYEEGYEKGYIDGFEAGQHDAQPERKKGKWISADAMFHGVPFYCSECGENTRDTVMGTPRWKFCPMCGSYNGGEQE